MTETAKKCFTCAKTGSVKFIDAKDLDLDKISYLDKLRSCVSADLIQNDSMEICWMCVKQLRVSYKFKKTVLTSQEALKKSRSQDVNFNVKNGPLNNEPIKKEVDSDDVKDVTVAADNSAFANDVHESCDNCMKTEDESPSEYFCKSDDFSSSDDDSDQDCKDYLEQLKSPTKSLQKKSGTRKYVRKPKIELVLECDHCGAKFNKRWKLKKHMSRVHNQVRKYVCTYCEKEFKQSYHLKEHITSHTGEKNYSCTICDKKFQRLSSQRRHIRSHERAPGHKTKRTPFLCTICGKSFPFSNGVQRHMRIHLGIKNFECKLCNRRFTQSTHLQVHMRTHTGEKPYICDTCGEKFSLKSCLLKHIHNRHYSPKNLAEEVPILYMQNQT